MANIHTKKAHYVNNPEFFDHIKKYLESVKYAKTHNLKIPQVTDYIGECIQSIAAKLANRPNFANYPFRDEMISDGIENSLQYISNFNPDKSNNPFAYFTQIIYFAFIRRIQKEKKHLYAKYKLIEESLNNNLDDNISAPRKYGSEQADFNLREFIESFEKGQTAKKAKSKISQSKKKGLGFDDIFEHIDHEIVIITNSLDEVIDDE